MVGRFVLTVSGEDKLYKKKNKEITFLHYINEQSSKKDMQLDFFLMH